MLVASSTAMSSVSFGPRSSSQGWLTAVDLHQHPLLGHATAPEPVLLGAAAARTSDAHLGQDAAHCGTAQVDTLAFPQQFGEMSVVGSGVAVAGQLHHGSRSDLRDSIVGPAALVPMGPVQRDRALR